MSASPFFCYIFLVALWIAHSVYYYSSMPDKMASHFGGSGQPNDWAYKESFFAGAFAILFLNAIVFIVIPWVFQKMRVKKMNLPNRDYWLAPERIDHVYEYFRNKMAWFGIVNLVFGIGVMQMVFSANLRPEQHLDNMFFLFFLVGYFVLVIIWLITFFQKFNKIG